MHEARAKEIEDDKEAAGILLIVLVVVVVLGLAGGERNRVRRHERRAISFPNRPTEYMAAEDD